MAQVSFKFLAVFVFAFLAATGLTAQGGPNPSTEPATGSGIVPVTTKSAEAHDLFVHALVKLENLHGPEAMQDFRKAVQLDPDFALANIIMAFPTVDPIIDPAEQASVRTRPMPPRPR